MNENRAHEWKNSSNNWYLQHMPQTLKTRDVGVLWSKDEVDAYYDIAQRAKVDRCQCYRLIAIGRDLVKLNICQSEAAFANGQSSSQPPIKI